MKDGRVPPGFSRKFANNVSSLFEVHFSFQMSPTVQTATRERPRTSSQTSLPSAVPPPVSSTVPQSEPPPAKPATSFDLLSDFGGDPFAQQQPQQQQSQGIICMYPGGTSLYKKAGMLVIPFRDQNQCLIPFRVLISRCS